MAQRYQNKAILYHLDLGQFPMAVVSYVSIWFTLLMFIRREFDH